MLTSKLASATLLGVFTTVLITAVASTSLAHGDESESGTMGVSWGTDAGGSNVVISGSQTTPGTGGSGPSDSYTGDDGSWDWGDTFSDSSDSSTWISPLEQMSSCLNNWDDGLFCYRHIERAEETTGEISEDASPEEPGMPAVTITDLARFAPPSIRISGEPDNLGIAGLPTNFTAVADTRTEDGTLFGYPISARFTPVEFTFHYGDGTTTQTTTGGATWQHLGQAQFTPTATSHAYRDRGTYDARIDVAYAAELDLGAGWFALPGTLTITGDTAEVRIFEAHTALVAHTCQERPAAPGC